MAKAHNPAYPQLRDGAVTLYFSASGCTDTVYADRVVTDVAGVNYVAGPLMERRARERVGPYHN